MPVIDPAVVLVNLTPSSTADPSLESTVAGTLLDVQMLQGQPEPFADVVKVHVTGAMTLPLGSAAPLTVAVNCVEVDRAAPGVNVAVCVELLYAVVPLTVVPVGPVSVMFTVEPWTGSLKVALTVLVVGTFVAPLAGLWLVT